MKKYILILFLVISALTASAESGLRIGPNVNLGLCNNFDGEELSFNFGGGALVDYTFNNGFMLQSGLSFDYVNSCSYLDIPIFAGYKYGISEYNSFFVEAGPTLGVGLIGTFWGDKFDLGLGGRVGMDIYKFQVSLGANYSVLSNSNNYSSLTFNLAVAYMFNL